MQPARLRRVGEEPGRLDRPRRTDLIRPNARVERCDLRDQIARRDVRGPDRLTVDRNDVHGLRMDRVDDRLGVAEHDRVVADRVGQHRQQPWVGAARREQRSRRRRHRQVRVGEQLSGSGGRGPAPGHRGGRCGSPFGSRGRCCGPRVGCVHGRGPRARATGAGRLGCIHRRGHAAASGGGDGGTRRGGRSARRRW